MNGRYKHLLGNQGVDISEGQMWIRRPDVAKINNPLNIEIISEPDEEEDRFYVRDMGQNKYLFFYREDIVNHYDKKVYTGPLELNEQIYEILGGRDFRSEKGEVRHLNKYGKSEIPDYSNNPKLADMLLHGLEKYGPKIKVRMGKYTVYLDKPYNGTTREEAICKAWIDKNR